MSSRAYRANGPCTALSQADRDAERQGRLRDGFVTGSTSTATALPLETQTSIKARRLLRARVRQDETKRSLPDEANLGRLPARDCGQVRSWEASPSNGGQWPCPGTWDRLHRVGRFERQVLARRSRARGLAAAPSVTLTALTWSRSSRSQGGLADSWRARCVQRALPADHSINSPASCSSGCGIASPSALAVRRLSTRSKRLGCSIGRSPALAPRRMRSTC
jgi:hypothetical protein